MNESVAIVGAGPIGLAAALFLHERGVPARVFDAAAAPTQTSKALVVNPRALSLLAGTGVAEAMIAEGRALRGVTFYEDWREIAQLDTTDAPTPYAMTVLTQARSEALLAEALARRGIEPRRSTPLTALAQDARGVSLEIGGEHIAAPLALGADGTHSFVRKALRVEFTGSAFPEDWPLIDLALNDLLDLDHAHVCFVERGLLFLIAIEPGLWRVFGNVPNVLDRLPPGSVAGRRAWESTFRVSDRRAAQVASGRVALAGDAAHIHSPVGARGMNFGIEDAHVFAGCVAARRDDPAAALARYDALRRPVQRAVVRRMSALTRLARGRPGWLGVARRHLLPALTGFAPTHDGIRDFMTGLAPAFEEC